MKRLGIAALVLLAACAAPGSNAAPTASTISSPTSSPAGERLFAARTGAPCARTCPLTVAIVGLDGRTRAKATFDPPVLPSIGCEGGFIATDVQVAAGSVYYLDSSGAIHRLRPSGQNQVVATFPLLTTQQITSFAVSPDGAKLMASIVAFPPLVSPPIDPSQGCPEHVQGDTVVELDAASVDGPSQAVFTQRSPFGGKGAPAHLIEVVGWDGTGPIAVTDLHVAYIGFVQGTIWLGPVAHL